MPVSFRRDVDLGVITINNPPVNALSQDSRQGILDALVQAQGEEIKAIVLLCEGRTFIAGADINEFGKPIQGPTLSEVNAAIESSAQPVLEAIHGTAPGGGFELPLQMRSAISDSVPPASYACWRWSGPSVRRMT